MINIRLNIFETNSSSTHSLVVMTKAQYKKWSQDDHNFIHCVKEHFIKPEDIKKIYTFDEIKQKYNDDHKDRRWAEDKEPSERDIIDWAEYYGYLPFDNYNSIEGEFEDYMILSVYIPE